jgi:hypothetical protein
LSCDFDNTDIVRKNENNVDVRDDPSCLDEVSDSKTRKKCEKDKFKFEKNSFSSFHNFTLIIFKKEKEC